MNDLKQSCQHIFCCFFFQLLDPWHHIPAFIPAVKFFPLLFKDDLCLFQVLDDLFAADVHMEIINVVETDMTEFSHLRIHVTRYRKIHHNEVMLQIHRTDILFDSLRRSSGLIEALQPLADDPARFDYFVAIITSAMIGVLTVWVEHGKTETEDQMVQKLTSAFIEMAILELPG